MDRASSAGRVIAEHTAEGIFFEKIALFDVAMYHLFRFVPSLTHDGEGVHVVLGGAGGKAPAQAVPGKIFGIQSRQGRILFHNERHRFITEMDGAKRSRFRKRGPSERPAASIQSRTARTAQMRGSGA